MYRLDEPALLGELTPEILQRAVQSLPEGAFVTSDQERGPPVLPSDAGSFAGVKDGAYAERDGMIVIRNGFRFDATPLSASATARIRGMMAVRDAVRLVFQTQLEDAPESTITEARQDLNCLYDHFVSRYGPLSSRENVRGFAEDPDHPLLLSLENFDAETGRAAKMPVFERRTLERHRPKDHVDTAAEALAISLNGTGGIDWPMMAKLTGRSSAIL